MTCSAVWSYTPVHTELLVLLTSAAQDSSQNLDPLHASHCNDKIMFLILLHITPFLEDMK